MVHAQREPYSGLVVLGAHDEIFFALFGINKDACKNESFLYVFPSTHLMGRVSVSR